MHQKSMENQSGERFSFPTIPIEGKNFEFEFNSTPDSPKSPADHLFINGKLQPHTFPRQSPNPSFINLPRSTSRSSSIGSIDSLLSSRSNSTNSISRSGSSCSSARTSISEVSGAADRKLSSSMNHRAKIAAAVSRKNSVSRDDSFWNHYQTKKPALTPHFSSSRRWQFITPAPALKSPSSRRVKGQRDGWRSTEKGSKDDISRGGAWFDWRIFKWFVSSCLSCHAIDSSATED